MLSSSAYIKNESIGTLDLSQTRDRRIKQVTA